MSLRRLIALTVVSTTSFFVCASEAAAQGTDVWASAAQWGPGRIVLGIASIAFAVGLTRPQRD